MIEGLAHIGVAVKDIDEGIKFFEEKFGAVLDASYGKANFGLHISAVVKINDLAFELLQPTQEGVGPVGKFIAEKGYNVALLDKSEFPRDKVCGGALRLSIDGHKYIMSGMKKIELIRSKEVRMYPPGLKHVACFRSKEPVMLHIRRGSSTPCWWIWLWTRERCFWRSKM